MFGDLFYVEGIGLDTDLLGHDDGLRKCGDARHLDAVLTFWSSVLSVSEEKWAKPGRCAE
jgi:hypothetical protein